MEAVIIGILVAISITIALCYETLRTISSLISDMNDRQRRTEMMKIRSDD